ncbi:M24 family metallopeptidase [Brevibacillus sp. SYSU BS000544]|uniref:M24 family metallopeptidase n=1 Tax=Brevibacillus sp. SYSU BS000544 TaxID=3416443 RepID=UPI003CE54B35
MQDRLNRMLRYMEKKEIDAALITHPKNVFYLTGFFTDPHERFMALVLIKGEEPFLFLPALDRDKAAESSLVTKIYTYNDDENPYEVWKSHLPSTIDRLGVETGHLTARNYKAVAEALRPKEIVDVEEPLQNMRQIKSQEELTAIRKAIWVIEEGLRLTLPKVKRGVSERDIAAELEYQTKKLGAEGPSFSTIVLTGKKAGMPHGTPGDRTVREGEVLLIDAGVFVDGYVSDLTRTFAIGELDHVLMDMYSTVLEANLRAIEAVRPQTPISEVDRVARDVIRNKGYGEYFINRVGHGIGLEIHEYPSVHGRAPGELLEGMVFTIEPGIYNPLIGGIRIEDDVLVTKEGVEVLTTFPKEMITIEL